MQPPPYVMNPELRRRKIEQELFADWPGAAAETGRITPGDEEILFKQLHYSAHRLSRLYKAADRSLTPSVRRAYTKWVERYKLVRKRLIEGNLGLVYQLIGKSRFSNLDRDEMSSEGMMALLRAVDTFDPWRGFRFSTYACNAIIRAFSRAALLDTRRRSRIAGPYDVAFERSDSQEQSHQDQKALFAERLQRILHLDNADLTDVEKTVLARRFPFEPGRVRQTLEEIGKRMRVSKERVRQIQLSAIAKLRAALAADAVLQ
jgi:RNA polymerase primary sigma factor